MSAPLLRLDRAAFGYGARLVLSDVDLAIDPGAFIGIVGPNGSGKTTLFRGMLGLIEPRSGRVERAAAAAGLVGYVPQRESLDPIYPVRVDEVVEMGAYGRLSGWRRLARAERDLARASLARVGLAERARDPFSTLSGGQRQRVLIARALMVRPRLLLLDEPTSGVDRAAQAQILELLLELNAHDGIAVLLVSHQLALLRETVARILWVADGRVAAGASSEILSPANLDRLFSAAAGSETQRAAGPRGRS